MRRTQVHRGATEHTCWTSASTLRLPNLLSLEPFPQSDEALRREEEELQRALAESAALADPRRGYQPSQPSNDSSFRKPAPQQSSGRPSSPREEAFVPPSSSSVIPQRTQAEDRRDSSEGLLRSQEQSAPQRVKALYDFETQASDELPFRKGDTIRVIECQFAAWWRGELRGRTGIFPTVYVVRSSWARAGRELMRRVGGAAGTDAGVDCARG